MVKSNLKSNHLDRILIKSNLKSNQVVKILSNQIRVKSNHARFWSNHQIKSSNQAACTPLVRRAKRVEWWAKLLFPLTLAAWNLYYWSVLLVKYNHNIKVAAAGSDL